MGWLRLDEDVLSHPQVAQLVAEQGANGVAAWIFTLTTAKRRNDKGRVPLSALVMGRDCGLSTELAAAAIAALVTNGLVEMTPDVDVYQVPNWPIYQPDPRPDSKLRTPREPQGAPGQRDVTGRDETKKEPRERAHRRPTAVIAPAGEAQRDRNRRMAVVAAEAHQAGQLGRVSAALTAAGTDNPEAARAALEAAS